MISYRDATPDDGPMLGGLARATFLETFGHLYKLPDLEAFLAQGSDQAYAAEMVFGEKLAQAVLDAIAIDTVIK